MAFPNYNGYYPQNNFYPQNNCAAPDMLNAYKYNYQPQPAIQPMQNQQVPQQPQPPVNEMIWVQGEAGAKAYLVAPNNTVVLWDSENQTIYVKSADSSGIPSTRVLDWVERPKTAPNQSNNAVNVQAMQTPSIDDFNALKGRIEAMQGEIDRLNYAIVEKATNKQEVDKNGESTI